MTIASNSSLIASSSSSPSWRARVGRRRAELLVLAVALGGGGCGSSSTRGPTNLGSDMAAWQGSADLGACGSLFAQVGFANCPVVSGDGGLPRCTGAAPLDVTLVPVTPPGINGVLWALSDGGTPPSSEAPLPSVSYAMPGHYNVRLVVTGAGCGQASARAEIDVTNAATGGACDADAQCGGSDTCVCARPAPDAGVTCPGELSGGLCTRVCTGGGCDASEACVDLSRTTWRAKELADQPFRHPLCLPTCGSDADCARLHAGFTCRELPVLVDGAGAGGAITWRKACFGKTAFDDGHGCADANGKPAPGDCVGGWCLPLGARNLCTSPCGNDPCPSTTACATFNFDPSHPFCLPRCDANHPCADPLFDCREPDAEGWFGFAVANGQAPGTTFCAPRRCYAEGECAPAGRCAMPGGGADGGVRRDGGEGAMFCLP